MVADREEAGNISDDLVVTKYKMAAEITNSKYKYIHPICKYTNLLVKVLFISKVNLGWIRMQ